MTPTPRRLANAVLRAVFALAPRQSREWASAMQRELDFIQGDWAALFWALGSAGAILRHAATAFLLNFKNRSKEENGMNTNGRKAVGVGLGMLSALMLAGCAFAVLRIAVILFPSLEHSHIAYWVAVLIVPETIFVAATIVLWRRKGPIAAGILATGLVMALHVAVHFAMR